jgi:hypothetical protein
MHLFIVFVLYISFQFICYLFTLLIYLLKYYYFILYLLNKFILFYLVWLSQVQGLAMGWTVRESNPGGVRSSAPFQIGPVIHPASCTKAADLFPGGKAKGCRR